MKISPIITSTLISAFVLWIFALYEIGPFSGCSMGIMRLPFILGIVPPVTGVLSLPAYIIMIVSERRGIKNKLLQTLMGVLVQLPLSFIITVFVTPLEEQPLWECIFGG
ncbi:MAG: hypothetical protein KTR29_13520 [Rhodothermaceae bacterium]|nr:hypothetical protein [Rhodothermaceae bacterium]